MNFSNSFEDETVRKENRTARKSTAASTTTYPTRRQAAKNASRAISASEKSSRSHDKTVDKTADGRERRKVTKKASTTKPSGALYDEKGIHLATGLDLCDCLNERCPGCWFECLKCYNSTKCGTECRVLRKYLIESIDFEGYEHTVKNPILMKNIVR